MAAKTSRHFPNYTTVERVLNEKDVYKGSYLRTPYKIVCSPQGTLKIEVLDVVRYALSLREALDILEDILFS